MTVAVHAALILAVGICHGKAFDCGKINCFLRIRNREDSVNRRHLRHKISTEPFSQVFH